MHYLVILLKRVYWDSSLINVINVGKGIMFEKSKVCSWIYMALDRTNIKAELKYLLKTNEYIEKHKLFDEYLDNKSK